MLYSVIKNQCLCAANIYNIFELNSDFAKKGQVPYFTEMVNAELV
jgi:hypothetical protein